MARRLSKYERAYRERAGHGARTTSRPQPPSDAELERMTAPTSDLKPTTVPPQGAKRK